MARKNEIIAPDVVERYRSGAPVKAIMGEFGLSQDTIYRMVDQAGLARRGRGNRRSKDTGDATGDTGSTSGDSSGSRTVPKQSAKRAPAAQKRAAKKTGGAKRAASKRVSKVSGGQEPLGFGTTGNGAAMTAALATGLSSETTTKKRGRPKGSTATKRAGNGRRRAEEVSESASIIVALTSVQREIDELAAALAAKQQTRKELAGRLAVQ